jgi:hypothetical protein
MASTEESLVFDDDSMEQYDSDEEDNIDKDDNIFDDDLWEQDDTKELATTVSETFPSVASSASKSRSVYPWYRVIDNLKIFYGLKKLQEIDEPSGKPVIKS